MFVASASRHRGIGTATTYWKPKLGDDEILQLVDDKHPFTIPLVTTRWGLQDS